MDIEKMLKDEEALRLATRSATGLADYIAVLSKDPDFENQRIDDYLEALAAWIRDAHGAYRFLGKQLPKDLNWQSMAVFFENALLIVKHDLDSRRSSDS